MRQIPALVALAVDPDVTVTGVQNYTSIFQWVVALSQDELNGIGQSYHRQVGRQSTAVPLLRRQSTIVPPAGR